MKAGMYLFLITFFLIYGLVHIYAFLRAKAAFSFGLSAGIPIALFMAFMMLAPFVIRFSERLGAESFARIISYIGYTWLAVLFLFACSSIVIDLYRAGLYALGLISRRDFPGINPSPGFSFFLPLALSVVVSIYGYFEAKAIRTEKITLSTSKLPAGIEMLRVVQLSDVHVGLIVRGRRLRRILAEVKKAAPDILVSTGDLVDGQINRLVGCAEPFKEIKAKYGKFAITGNHEFYAGIEEALNFTEQAGFKILRAEGITGPINIVGLDDPQGKTYGLYRGADEEELLRSFPQDKFTLLLKHRPLVDGSAAGLFDLQLSGHVHKGQIFPFRYATRIFFPVVSGWKNLEGGSLLYVSRGAGTWGPPIRFLAPPEITVIEILREKDHIT